MPFSNMAISRPVFTTVMMATILIFGWLGFQRMGIDLYPPREFPIVSVVSILPGASPEVMDQDVTDVIEAQIKTVEGVDFIQSQSSEGQSSVTVFFVLEKNIDVAVQEVRDKVASVSRNLPRDLDPPIIQKVDPDASPIMWVAVSGDGPYSKLLRITKDVVRERLQSLPGVGGIVMGGFQDRAIRVWLEPGRLEAYDLSPLDVNQAIRSRHVELPGGRLETALLETSIRVNAEFTSPRELEGLVVAYRDGAPVRLRDVAAVEDGLADVRSMARFNGRPTIGLGVQKQSGTNTVAVADEVKKALAELREQVPDWVRIMDASDSSIYVKESIHGVEEDLLLGVLFTSFIILFFLHNWRAMIISLLAIPISLIGGFSLMSAMGFTLNNMTMLALALAVGLVIDDAVVVMEAIYRRREHGVPAMEAARQGVADVAFAVIAATVAVAAIFVPVAFMPGVVGNFFLQFGATVAITIMISLLVSLTLTPMLCSRFLGRVRVHDPVARVEKKGVGDRIGDFLDGLDRMYRRMLGWCLRWRIVVVLLAAATFAAGAALFPRVGMELVPKADESRFMIRFETPLGSSLQKTDAAVKKAEKLLFAHPEVRSAFMAIGFGGGGVNGGIFFARMVPPQERPVGADGKRMTQMDLMNVLRKELNSIPGFTAFVFPIDALSAGGGFRAARIQYVLVGPELDGLARYSEEITRRMKADGGFQDVDTDLELTRPQIRVDIDRSAANDLGLTELQISEAIQTMMGGVNVARYKEGGSRYDIRVKAREDARQVIGDIGEISVRARGGELVRLKATLDAEAGFGPNIINRYDRKRAVTIYADPAGIEDSTAQQRFLDIVAQVLPPGGPYQALPGGTSKLMGESFGYLTFALGLSVLIIYLVLAAQFESFLHPFTVMLSLPLAGVGALGAMVALGKTLNLFSFIGIVMLVGIVTRNAILLVDCANAFREKGMDRDEAVLEAGPVRLRPILMTSFAAMLALLPVALGLTVGAETRSPLGVAVIGGLFSSTFLTLLVVPVFYTLIDDAGRFVRGIYGRLRPRPVSAG